MSPIGEGGRLRRGDGFRNHGGRSAFRADRVTLAKCPGKMRPIDKDRDAKQRGDFLLQFCKKLSGSTFASMAAEMNAILTFESLHRPIRASTRAASAARNLGPSDGQSPLVRTSLISTFEYTTRIPCLVLTGMPDRTRFISHNVNVFSKFLSLVKALPSVRANERMFCAGANQKD